MIYILIFNDIIENMNWNLFIKIEKILDKYNIKHIWRLNNYLHYKDIEFWKNNDYLIYDF